MKKPKHKLAPDGEAPDRAEKNAKPIRQQRQASKAEKQAVYLEQAEPLPKR